jgi:hypothetical protein
LAFSGGRPSLILGFNAGYSLDDAEIAGQGGHLFKHSLCDVNLSSRSGILPTKSAQIAQPMRIDSDSRR